MAVDTSAARFEGLDVAEWTVFTADTPQEGQEDRSEEGDDIAVIEFTESDCATCLNAIGAIRIELDTNKERIIEGHVTGAEVLEKIRAKCAAARKDLEELHPGVTVACPPASWELL
jgi:hypothetical protein